jgi:hypothetical protein
MISWMRTRLKILIVSTVCILVIVGLATLYLGAPEARRSARELDPIAKFESFPAASIEVAPALDTTDELEDTDAVRAVRATYAASAWARVINSTDFAQYSLFIRANNYTRFQFSPSQDRAGVLKVPLAPIAFTPMAITTSEDGTVTVDVCEAQADSRPWLDLLFGDVITYSDPSRFVSHPQAIELTPLTENELARLGEYQVPDGLLRVRGTVAPTTDFDCTDVSIVQQTFTAWEQYLER